MLYPIDISERIERLASHEQKAGITLRGLFAYLNEYSWVGINGEIHSLTGDLLKSNVRLTADLIDDQARVVGTHEFVFYTDSFFGFETFSTEINPQGIVVSKIRLHPREIQ